MCFIHISGEAVGDLPLHKGQCTCNNPWKKDPVQAGQTENKGKNKKKLLGWSQELKTSIVL